MINRFGLLDSTLRGILTAEGREAFMYIHRLLGLGLALALCLSAAPVTAQRGGTQPQRPDSDTVALVQAVDAAIVAMPAAQTSDQTQGEIPVKWESAHFIKGQNGVYVPYTISFDPAAVKTTDIAVYIRAVEKSQLPAVAATLTPPAAAQGSKPPQPPPVPKYPWDNVHFLQKPADGRITRAIALPPGEYEVFIALKERSAAATAAPPAATPPAAGSARVGLLRHPLNAPDFNKPELQTSSVILANSVEPVSGQLSPAEQEANPYVFGPMRIVPARETRFAKTSELQVIFWIYGAGAAANGKPDVTVDFNFYLKQPDGSEKYFNKTAPQELNAQTLPPEFSAAAGHQLPGSLVVGLMPFPAGDYRLEIKITDKAGGKMVTQNVTFTVTA
jgi:hypothetical protein